MKQDEVANREPISAEEVEQEVDDVFRFNPPQTQENLNKCKEIQAACKNLALLIIKHVPQGKEQVIAVNNLVSTALFACHGITRRQVVVVAVPNPS